MSNVLNKETKEILYSVNTPDYSTDQYIINPDLDLIKNIGIENLKISGNNLIEKTIEEKALEEKSIQLMKGIKINSGELNINTIFSFIGFFDFNKRGVYDFIIDFQGKNIITISNIRINKIPFYGILWYNGKSNIKLTIEGYNVFFSDAIEYDDTKNADFNFSINHCNLGPVLGYFINSFQAV